jgi:hypothetical protein
MELKLKARFYYKFIIKMSEKTLDKHKRYKSKYGKNEMYWGIGIENEMYLEFEDPIHVSDTLFLTQHHPERYSLNYFNSYKDNISDLFKVTSKDIILPLLVNSHTFLHTDINNEHKTTFEKDPKPNNKCEKTIHELCMEKSSYFSSHYKENFVYDGDTIEFITQDFYKTNVKDVIEELKTIKNRFIEEIQPIFPKKIQLLKKNYPFAVYLTNLKNVSLFNNGTIHFNFTLPTQLNENGEIKDKEQFINDHRNAIRVLQLFEPIFIAIYGSPDPFFHISSQRCAVSRYIGIGTYDTLKMERGKILHVESSSFSDDFWYHQPSVYKKLDKIGLDINFNKHHYHGIEFRIFDYILDEYLEEVITFMIHLFDHSLEYEYIDNIVSFKQWNELVLNCLQNGKETIIPSSQMFLFNMVFQKTYKPMNVVEFYELITTELKEKYKGGKCSIYMIENKEYSDVKEINNCCILI